MRTVNFLSGALVKIQIQLSRSNSQYFALVNFNLKPQFCVPASFSLLILLVPVLCRIATSQQGVNRPRSNFLSEVILTMKGSPPPRVTITALGQMKELIFVNRFFLKLKALKISSTGEASNVNVNVKDKRWRSPPPSSTQQWLLYRLFLFYWFCYYRLLKNLFTLGKEMGKMAFSL